MISGSDLTEQLRALHQDYTEQVNLAIAEGRDDIVDELVATYPDEALQLLVAAGTRT